MKRFSLSGGVVGALIALVALLAPDRPAEAQPAWAAWNFRVCMNTCERSQAQCGGPAQPYCRHAYNVCRVRCQLARSAPPPVGPAASAPFRPSPLRTLRAAPSLPTAPAYRPPTYIRPAYVTPSYRPPAWTPPAYRPPAYHRPAYRPPAYQPPAYRPTTPRPVASRPFVYGSQRYRATAYPRAQIRRSPYVR